jgi:hypothetical protein
MAKPDIEKDEYAVNYTGEVLRLTWNSSDICGYKLLLERIKTGIGEFRT